MYLENTDKGRRCRSSRYLGINQINQQKQ